MLLNGRIVGYLHKDLADNFEWTLRSHKTEGTIDPFTEVAVLRRSAEGKSPIFPGIYINDTEARLMRPVKNLKSGLIEYISPLEQINMSIAVTQADIRSDTVYQELDPAFFLSILAANVPFLNYN